VNHLITPETPQIQTLADYDLGLHDALAGKSPTLDYIIPLWGFLARSVGCLAAPGATGKSFFALQLAIALAGGLDLLGIGDHPIGHVRYLCAEDPRDILLTRLASISRHLHPDDADLLMEHLHLSVPPAHIIPDLMTPAGVDALSFAGEGMRLLVIDTFRRFHLGDENSSTDMTVVLRNLEIVTERTGCAILFLHHVSKGAAINGQGDSQQALKGSAVIGDHARWAGSLVGMTKQESEDCNWIDDPDERWRYVQFAPTKINYGTHPAPQWLRREAGGVLVRNSTPDNAEAEELTRAMRAYRDKDVTQVAQEVGYEDPY